MAEVRFGCYDCPNGRVCLLTGAQAITALDVATTVGMPLQVADGTTKRLTNPDSSACRVEGTDGYPYCLVAKRTSDYLAELSQRANPGALGPNARPLITKETVAAISELLSYATEVVPHPWGNNVPSDIDVSSKYL